MSEGKLQGVTNDGTSVDRVHRVIDVAKALGSVARTGDRGKRVMFRGFAAGRRTGCKSVRLQNAMVGQAKTFADVNKASRGANEIRDKWLRDRAHQCLRTQYDDVSLFSLNIFNSCS